MGPAESQTYEGLCLPCSPTEPGPPDRFGAHNTHREKSLMLGEKLFLQLFYVNTFLFYKRKDLTLFSSRVWNSQPCYSALRQLQKHKT